MPALRGGAACFAHSEKTRAQRSAARARGGAANRRAPAPAPARGQLAPEVAAFEIGPIRRKADIAKALVRLSQALAKGEIDRHRGRLVAESLRAAALAAGDETDLADHGGRPVGARPATDEELDFVIEHGEFPEGVEPVDTGELWVTGHPWIPPAIEPPAGGDPEAG